MTDAFNDFFKEKDPFLSMPVIEIGILEREASYVNDANRYDMVDMGIESIQKVLEEDQIPNVENVEEEPQPKHKYEYGSNPVEQLAKERSFKLFNGENVDPEEYFQNLRDGNENFAVVFNNIKRGDQQTVTIGRGYAAESWIPGAKLSINKLNSQCVITYIDSEGNPVHQTFRFKVSDKADVGEIIIPRSANIPKGSKVFLHSIAFDTSKPINLSRINSGQSNVTFEAFPSRIMYLRDALKSFKSNFSTHRTRSKEHLKQRLLLENDEDVSIAEINENSSNFGVQVELGNIELFTSLQQTPVLIVSSLFSATYAYYLQLPGYIEEYNLKEGYSNNSYQSYALIETLEGERRTVRIIQNEGYEDGPLLSNIPGTEHGFKILGIVDIPKES